MPKFVTAPAGTNPMEMPDLIKRNRASKFKLFGLIALALLALTCVCAVPAYFMTRPKAAVAAPQSTITPTQTASPTITATSSPTATGTRTVEVIPPMDLTRLAGLTATATSTRPAPTQTPWVVTRVVQQPGTNTIIEKHFEKTVVVTAVITATPGATQTPWMVTQVVEVEVTRIVEVTPTETPSPTPTEAPTAQQEVIIESPSETPNPTP